MNEDFIPFELSKKLKEKGFRYNKNNLLDRLCMENQINHPTISQVLKWLREEKKLSVEINFGAHPYSCIACWYCTIIKITEHGNRSDLSDFGKDCRVFFSYEEAALAGIEYTLNNLI